MSPKKILSFGIGVLILAALCGAYTLYTGDFRLSNIDYQWKKANKWTTTPPDDASITAIKTILNQKYTYLGRGNQTYAFVSADGKYVLKFFRFGHLKPSSLLEWLPNISFLNEYRDYKINSQNKRLNNNYQGHWIASTYNAANSGLKLVHLTPTNYLNCNATVVDRLGFTHTIDLDNVTFVLQEKAIIARDELKSLLSKGDVTSACKRIEQIFDLYLSEYEMGVYDRDHNVIDNIGFSGNHAMRIDVGKLRFDEKMKEKAYHQQDLQEKVIKRIDRWVKRDFPQYHQKIKEQLQSYTEEASELSF